MGSDRLMFSLKITFYCIQSIKEVWISMYLFHFLLFRFWGPLLLPQTAKIEGLRTRLKLLRRSSFTQSDSSKATSPSNSSSSSSTASRGPPVRMPVVQVQVQNPNPKLSQSNGDSGHETLLSDDDSPTPTVERASSEVIYSTIANG